jgi:hypothetical protein
MFAFSKNTVELHPLLPKKGKEDEAHTTLQKSFAALLGELNSILFREGHERIESVYMRLTEDRRDELIYSDVVHEEYIKYQWKRYFDTLRSIMPDQIDDGVSFHLLINEAQEEPLDEHLKSYRSTYLMYDLVVNFHSIYSFFFDVTYHENDVFHQHVMDGASYLGLEWKDVSLCFRKKFKEWRKSGKQPHKYDKLRELRRPMNELEERGIRMSDYAYKGRIYQGEYNPTHISPVSFSNLPWTNKSRTHFNMGYGLRGALFMARKDNMSKGLPDNAVYLMFAGTQFDNLHNLKTDVSQYLHSDAVYYASLAIMLEVNQERIKNNHPTFVVGGHSLGGGLAQFAVGACKDKSGLTGLGYNSAGLSNFFLSKVDGKRTKRFTHIFVENDPIHKWGNQIGRRLELEGHGYFPHGIDALAYYIGNRFFCE